MTKLSISYIALLLLCYHIIISLAIGTNGGNGGSRGNGSPGRRGGEGEDEAVNAAFEKLRTRLPALQNEFCVLCALAGGGSIDQETMSEIPQRYQVLLNELRPKLVSW